MESIMARIIHFEAAILCGGKGFGPKLIKIVNDIKSYDNI